MRYSWGSMLRTIRAAVAVLLLGGIGLTVPPQTRDMLAFLEDGRVWPGVSFELALIVLASSAWFWSRAALAARFGVDDRQRRAAGTPNFDWTAFAWLPRFMLFGGFAIGAVIASVNQNPWTIAGAVVLGIFGVILAVFRPRSANPPPVPAVRVGVCAWIRGGAQARLHALFRAAPFGPVPAVVLLVLGLVPLILGVAESFSSSLHLPNLLAAVFPGPGIAVLLLGLMIGPLVTSTFLLDGLTFEARLGRLHLRLRRPPVLSFIVLYVFVAVPALFHVHTVRLLGGTAAERRPIDQIFEQWVQTCAPGTRPIQPIIVAVSGGATRAGLWGAAVLDQVLRAQQQDGPSLFAVSSVSGGSLGVAAAMTLLSTETEPCHAKGLKLLRPTQAANVPLAGDALGPLLGGWLLDDIPRSAFDPFAAAIRWVTNRRPNGGDSAESIEHGFEDLWNEVRQNSAGTLNGWEQPFLSLFYTDEAGTYRAGMPLWLANGTDAATGNRVLTAPIAAPDQTGSDIPWPFRSARDFHRLMGADVSISTAINNTARFPYLEPFGEMMPLDRKGQVGSLVDGGYFENEGLQTALDLAEWLARQSPGGRPVQPIIVQATGNGKANVRTTDVMTCDHASDGPFIPSKDSAWQILAPLVGLYHVPGGHSAVLLRQAHDQFCEVPSRFVHFYLPADDKGRAIPLNWVLSNKTGRFIWAAFNSAQVSNATELERLGRALRQVPP
jgi:hypothetical protein